MRYWTGYGRTRGDRNEVVTWRAEMMARNLLLNLRLNQTQRDAIVILCHYWAEVRGGLLPQLLLPVPQERGTHGTVNQMALLPV